MLIIKFLGLVLVVTVCSLIGVLKGQAIKLRCQRLRLFCESLDIFYEYIEQGNYELDRVIEKAFDRCDFLNDTYLNAQDKAMINDFFVSLGHSAKKAECDRIKCCSIAAQRQLAKAENDVTQKCKIYSVFGICIGLGIAVLLI
ncbi:MAG: stage III sporulation protein AB [Clostridia bacterium]|nr:stage III sporulation protein AB [Clostridia bacterium]